MTIKRAKNQVKEIQQKIANNQNPERVLRALSVGRG